MPMGEGQLTDALKRIQDALLKPEPPRPSRIDAIALLVEAVGFPADLANRLTQEENNYRQVRKVLALVLRRRAQNPAGMVRQALVEHWLVT